MRIGVKNSCLAFRKEEDAYTILLMGAVGGIKVALNSYQIGLKLLLSQNINRQH